MPQVVNGSRNDAWWIGYRAQQSNGPQRQARRLGQQLRDGCPDGVQVKYEQIGARDRVACARNHLEGRGHIGDLLAINKAEPVLIKPTQLHRSLPPAPRRSSRHKPSLVWTGRSEALNNTTSPMA